MTRRFNLLCALVLTCLFSTLAIAQPSVTDADVTKEGQISEFNGLNKATFPARPKSMWEIGLHGGHAFVSGDVNPELGYGFGIHVRKSLGYLFSLRLNAIYGQAKGLNTQGSTSGAQANSILRNLGYGTTRPYYYNYKNDYAEASIQGVFSLNNAKFHSAKGNWNAFGFIGLGGNYYKVMHDALDANGNTYDFAAISGDSDTRDGRAAIKDDLKNQLDGEYETLAENKVAALEIDAGDYTVTPVANIGAGLSFRLSKRINISAEHQITFSDNDLLDGKRWRGNDLSNNSDFFQYTSLRLNFNLGKAEKNVEPLYWLNPIQQPYEELAEHEKRIIAAEQLGIDDDGDGVANPLDKEANTPAGAIVDTRGVTLDSDADGVPDYQDKEPFSPIGYDVDKSTGIANVPKILTKEDIITIGKEQKWDEKPKLTTVRSNPPRDWFLPMIHFDLNRYGIKSQFYPHLHHVATVMKQNPGISIVVEGNADARSSNDYNQVLSYKRATEAINYLVSNYGISRSRLILTYKGEVTPLVKNSPKNYMNRRVEFRVAKGETEMARPAGPNAGKK